MSPVKSKADPITTVNADLEQRANEMIDALVSYHDLSDRTKPRSTPQQLLEKQAPSVH